MEEKKNTWAEAIANVLSEAEITNIRLGMDIAKLKESYYYSDIISVLKGTSTSTEDMYFGKLKPLYDKYGYEKVNRILLELETEKEQGGQENE